MAILDLMAAAPKVPIFALLNQKIFKLDIICEFFQQFSDRQGQKQTLSGPPSMYGADFCKPTCSLLSFCDPPPLRAFA